MSRNRFLSSALAFLFTVLGASAPTTHLSAQGMNDPASAPTGGAGSPGQRLATTAGIEESTNDIMRRQAAAPPAGPRPEHELEYPERSNLPQNPNAPAISRYPADGSGQSFASPQRNIHTAIGSFDGATLTDTGAFPPDSMGTVGPTQFIVFVNGRIRSFTKAGVADGVINADPDVFFASVRTPVSPPVVLDFTSDPQIRYDRFSGRWFMSIIDVPCTNATCSTTAPNRWLLAVSDAASAGTISGTTVWQFFFVTADAANFCDYPSLGIDVNALYFGCNMFSGAGAFVGTNGYVVQKTSSLGAGPLVVTAFANMAAGAGAGPESPRGVDNFDAGATEGYFVGPDNATFGTIMFRRISNPGSLTPTISANIGVTVPVTTLAGSQAVRLVQHAGGTGGNNGLLDSLDDRFYQAMIRNGRLWAAHNFTVTNAGVASTAAQSRNASRWYEFQNLTTTPTVVQSGTVFDNAATRVAARQYWIPSVTVTGQGHAVMGFTMAGTPVGATPAYVGRLAGDTLGTMTGPPAASVVSIGTTTANYNPPSDPGSTSGRRWGDYSFTVVDPLDDMSVWTIQEYNQALNSYAVRVGHLLAPPPATPTCSGSPIAFPGGTGNVVITATSTGGSGFYDPGSNLPPPALPFSHISATITNATVNSMTFNSPTQVTLNITANTAGLQNVTITNPDGQPVTANGCIDVQVATFTVTPSVTGNGTINPNTPQTVNPGATTAFTLTPNANNHIVNVTGTCGGTLVGNTFTTAAVTADCTVIANFAIDTFTVTPSVTGNGTIAPNTPQTVNSGATTAFTLTPNASNHIVNVTGTCGGALVGNTFTTAAVTADCTVIANFAIDTFTVTPSVTGNGTITPNTPQAVNSGATTAFTLTPNANNHIVNVTGTCGGALVGNTFTTAAVTADCTVIANFAIDMFTVTPSVTGNGAIAPNTPQTVNGGSTTAFTLTPNANNHIVNVTGTCGGTLVGTTFTTAAVTANCTVIANFALDTFTVTANAAGGNGTITPLSQTVNYGSAANFVVTPASGYHVASVTGSSCTLSQGIGNNWFSSAITANCSVTAIFAIDRFTVTASASGGNGTITPASQLVVAGETAAFVVTPAGGYHAASVIGDTCTVTHGAGNNWTSNAITANCAVTATFAPNVLVFTTQPADVTRGNALGTVVVTEQDGSGNTIIDNSSSVDFTIAACSGPVDLGSVAMVNGIATLTSTLPFYTLTSPPGLQINAATGALNATSQFFNVVPNPDLVFADGLEGCRL